MKNANTIKQYAGVKSFFCLVLTVVLLFCFTATVYAANQEPVLTVNTALNEENEDSEDNYPQPEPILSAEEPVWVWHPISVVNEPMSGFNTIRRTYALPPDVNPAVISTVGFDMFGQHFTFAYMTQQVTTDESTREIRETVTIEARSRNLNDILPHLQQEIHFERDGFAGTLVLDLHSITSEVAGTTRQTSTATRQRTFPHLSSPDNSLIPRTITEGGTTFHLASVDWQAAGMSVIDGHPVASSHTAHATFTAQVTQTRTTGYTITAEYVGTVFRTAQGKTLFTVVFYGEPIIEVWLEEPTAEVTPVEPGTQDAAEIPGVTGTQDANGAPAASGTPSEAATGISQPSQSIGSNAGNAARTVLAVIGILIALAAVGAGAFFLAKHFLGYNATVYSIDSPREIVKAGKIKLDLNSSEPTIELEKVVGQNPAKTDRYIIQVAQRAISKLINKELRVALQGKEAFHKVPESALGGPVYEFEVNFSDDDESDGVIGTAGAGGYPYGGDASGS